MLTRDIIAELVFSKGLMHYREKRGKSEAANKPYLETRLGNDSVNIGGVKTSS